MMIKILDKINRSNKNPLARVYNDKAVIEALKGYDIDLSTEHTKYAYTLIMDVDVIESELEENSIVIERIDGGQIKNENRKLLKNDNIVAWVKMAYYPELALNNLSTVEGRIFTRLTAPKVRLTAPKVRLTAKDMNKVTAGANFLHYHRHDKVASGKVDFTKGRKIDVFYAGTMDYDKNTECGRIITKHRQDCVNKLKEVKKNRKDLNIQIIEGRLLETDAYYAMMADSKLTISPWGWGSCAYRDCEGLLLGVDVIKPHNYSITTIPNIYDDTMWFCNTDWSNLEKKIDKCLETYDARKDLREDISKNLMEWRKPKTIAKMVKEIIKKVKKNR